ncbi:unnamed protein product [Urochloa decumbens]|uniref:Uncharacterized protein n=1 Tax=Urochloa decumbens TaxID=240449 RepID=A0ABC8Z101_9POAL
MAAIRSALALLGRRSFGSSGSSAAASFAGRGKEIQQVLRPAAPRTPPLPSLRPAGCNLEGWRRYSTKGRKPTEKLRTWWQRYKDHMNNIDSEERVRYVTLYALVVLGGPMIYRMKT